MLHPDFESMQCSNGRKFVWASSDLSVNQSLNKLLKNNLSFSSAIVLSGQSYKVTDLASIIGLSISSSVSFHSYQRHYMCPGMESYKFSLIRIRLISIKTFWFFMCRFIVVGQSAIVRINLIKLADDERWDSPGNSTDYCTYSLIDHITNKILHVETVDKCEVKLQSPNMEPEMFTSLWLTHFKLYVCHEIITDESSSVGKIIGNLLNVVFVDIIYFLKKLSNQSCYILWMFGINQSNWRKPWLRGE